MSALIHGLDTFTPTQLGENSHVEYGWSNDIQEKITQFSFQLTRTSSTNIDDLSHQLRDLLRTLYVKRNEHTAKHHLLILYKMIGHTRDIISGKGEYAISYMMIFTWHAFYPELAQFALSCFFRLEENQHPYGSWKDIKYFCDYCNKQRGDSVRPLINYAVQLMNHQIRADYANEGGISLAAKWAPREQSKFGWVFELLALDYFSTIMKTAHDEESCRKAALKCKTDYRKVLSLLNKKLDTTQIKQCAGEWSHIQFPHVTSVTISKQKKAFLNIHKNGTSRYPDSEDRTKCAVQFIKHCESGVKGKRVGMETFTKEALRLLHEGSHANAAEEVRILNAQWKDNSSNNTSLGKMVAMVDVSSSMSGDPMHAAIALGLRIAEKSILGKRVLTFSENPSWVNLEAYSDFVSQVDVLQKASWGGSTNFYAAFDMILETIVRNKLTSSDVEDMVLVILSDMQMNQADSCNTHTLYETMGHKYADAGIRICGLPYRLPHILFWNLRCTFGFPTCSSQSNASMLSGFNPSQLNLFCEKGFETCTPWSQLVKSVENARYTCLEERAIYVFRRMRNIRV